MISFRLPVETIPPEASGKRIRRRPVGAVKLTVVVKPAVPPPPGAGSGWDPVKTKTSSPERPGRVRRSPWFPVVTTTPLASGNDTCPSGCVHRVCYVMNMPQCVLGRVQLCKEHNDHRHTTRLLNEEPTPVPPSIQRRE